MPDMLPTFKSGDPRTKALNAGFLNNVTDRLRNIPQQSLPSSRAGGGQHVLSVYAINNSGGDIDERSVMAIDTVGLNITTDQEMVNFQERPLASIDIPTAATNFPVVAMESIRDGEIGKVAISGAVVCMVNVTDAGHAYANPTAGDETRMTSGATGQVRILYKPGGTGNKRCWVYLVEPSAAGGGGGGIQRSGHAWVSVNGSSSIPINQGLLVSLGETASGIFTWRATVQSSPVYGQVSLGVFKYTSPFTTYFADIARDLLEYAVTGTTRGAISGAISFSVTNDGTYSNSLSLYPYVSPGSGPGDAFITGFSYHAHVS